MKTITKKTLSIFCALALLVSALPAASAVESSALSDVAGETVSVHVTHIKADGQRTQALINVDIPKKASSRDAQELIQAAALATADPVTPLSGAEDWEFLCQWGNVRLTTSPKSITSVFFKHPYNRLVFQFNGGTCTGNPSNVILQLAADPSNILTIPAPLQTQSANTKSAEVIIYDGNSLSGTNAPLGTGKSLGITASVDRGEATFAGFMVKGYFTPEERSK